MIKTKLRKIALVTAGILALSLGIIGIFLPLLPTTPFLLLSAACFVRSSDRLYNWLIHHKWFGAYIRNYRENRALTLKSKIIALVILWGVIGYTALVVVTIWRVRALLAVMAIGVTIHLLHLSTLRPEMLRSRQKCFERGDA